MSQPPRRQHDLDAWLALTGQVPPPTAPVSLPLLTGSMVPTIPVGALLQITVGFNAPCQAGDVAVFLEHDTLTAHRVLLVMRCGPWDWLLEKGDANRQARWRRGAEVCGKVTGFTVDDQNTRHDPTDAPLASQEMRRTLIRACKFWQRPSAQTEEPEQHV